MNAIVAKVKAAYQKLSAHLVKTLGGLGLLVTTIDPQAVQSAASSYLGSNPQKRIGQALFVLVILRGWWTGRRATRLQAEIDALKSARIMPKV